MSCYHVRTNPGLEDILAEEILSTRDLAGIATLTSLSDLRAGWVELRTPRPLAPTAFSALRCAYEVLEVWHTETHEDLIAGDPEAVLGAVERSVASTDLPPQVRRGSFAVRCRRRGDHVVHSPAVERRSGAVISRRTATPVRLNDPDTLIRVDLSDDHMTIGRLVTRTPLDQRYQWIYRPRVTLSTVAAAAALRIAQSLRDPTTPAVLLDPFCGSGTIPLEAAQDRELWHRIHASDIAPEAVAGVRANLAANGAASSVAVRRADATELPRYYRDHGINTIVCNPPFGVRLGRRLDFGAFYGALLVGAAAITEPGSVLVLMSSRRRGRLNAVINRQTDWELMSVHLIETGGVFPGIFALRRRRGS